MLERVQAIRFVKRMEQGRTKPALVTIRDSNDAEIEVIAKLSVGCDLKVGSLTAEALAAMLASTLGLPAPRAYLTELTPEFVTTIADNEIRGRAEQSSPISFGSRRLRSGVRAWIAGAPIPAELLETAAEIFAFDALTDNVDRRVENSNLLTTGNEVWIYDHEMAFSSRLILGWKPPWEPGSREAYRDKHVLYEGVKGKSVSFTRFENAWKNVSDEILRQYSEALPKEWADDFGVADAAIGHIRNVRDNIGPSLTEIARVLR